MKTLDDLLEGMTEDRRKRIDDEFQRLKREQAQQRIWDMQAEKAREFANIASGFTRPK